MGAADWRNSLQRRRLVRHHLGCRQQQSPPPCPLHLSRRLQNSHETNLVILSYSISNIIGYGINNCSVHRLFLIVTQLSTLLVADFKARQTQEPALISTNPAPPRYRLG